MKGSFEKNCINVLVTEYEVGCGYHYLVKKGVNSWTAFATAKGYRDFIKRNNLKFKLTSQGIDNATGGWFKNYECISEGRIIYDFFWDLKDIPKEAIKYKNLSNGSYVDCYYWNKGNDSFDYRPNPNAKSVYIPLSVEEHVAYSRTNG